MKKSIMPELEKFQLMRDLGYEYDSETGIVTHPRGNELLAMKIGWVYFKFPTIYQGKYYSFQVYAHRYGYWYATGELPNVVDHINKVRYDNRLVNLRSVTPQENTQNRSEVKGYITQQHPDGTISYIAHYFHKRKRFVIGKFSNEQDAIEAYQNYKENK